MNKKFDNKNAEAVNEMIIDMFLDAFKKDLNNLINNPQCKNPAKTIENTANGIVDVFKKDCIKKMSETINEMIIPKMSSACGILVYMDDCIIKNGHATLKDFTEAWMKHASKDTISKNARNLENIMNSDISATIGWPSISECEIKRHGDDTVSIIFPEMIELNANVNPKKVIKNDLKFEFKSHREAYMFINRIFEIIEKCDFIAVANMKSIFFELTKYEMVSDEKDFDTGFTDVENVYIDHTDDHYYVCFDACAMSEYGG